MIFGFLDNKPALEESSVDWLFDAYAWSLENFDARLFFDDTLLVLPNGKYFPGSADGVAGMASLVLDQVKHYANMRHWPTTLVDQGSTCSVAEPPRVDIKGALRGPEGVVDDSIDEAHRLPVGYVPQQVSNPEGLIAGFAHTLAHYLAQTAKRPPPGGVEFWPAATELLAIYLGFGLMFANSAFTFRGGCGSCGDPRADRNAYLSEREATYALALFSVLKEIPDAEATRHLKRHLRGTYKQMVRDIKRRDDDLAQLRIAGGVAPKQLQTA